MNKKYFLYLLKKWLPFFFIIFAVVGSVSIINATTGNYYASYYVSEGYEYVYLSTNVSSYILQNMIPAMIASFIMPLAVYSFRYNKQDADTYLMFPVKKNSIRRTRLAVGLLYLEAAIFACYWICIGIFALKQALLPIPENTSYLVHEAKILHYEWTPLVYLCIAFFVGLQYCINCFFISLGNNPRDSILFWIAGVVGLNLICISPVMLYNSLAGRFGGSTYGPWTVFLSGAGPIFPCYFVYNLFNSLMVDGVSSSHLFYEYPDEIVSLVAFIVVGIAAGAYIYLRDDPSGEYFGGRGPRKPYITSVIHACAFIIILLSIAMYINIGGGITNFMTNLIGLIFEGVIYLGALALIYRKFALPKHEWIVFGSEMGIYLLSLIVFGIIV